MALNGALDRGATAVTFDGGSGANFAAIGAYQELWIGSAAGKYDVGRIRIRSITSADSGVSGTVTIAANSIATSDNNYLTFIGWYIFKPIRPLIGDDGTFYKDSNIAYSNQNSQPSPVCIAGENRAGFIDATAGYFEVESQLPSSYVMASGATISSYAASLVWGADASTISINSGTGVGYIRFDAPGLYWIKWSVTDSNGKTRDTYRWYYAHSPLASNAHYPITSFSVNNLSGDYEAGGWSAGIQFHDDATLEDIPDYAPCIAGGHKTLVPELVQLLRKQGRGDILVVAGGVIPEQDGPALRVAGVADIFGPGTVIPTAAVRLLDLLAKQPNSPA